MADLRSELLRRVANGAGIRPTAREMGVPASTALMWVKKERDTPHVAEGEEVPAQTAAERRVIQLENDLRYARARARAAEGDQLSAERVREELFGLAARSAEPPHWLVAGSVGGSAPGVPVVMASDFHWGEVVRPEEVGGVNAYNVEVAERRVRRLVQVVIDLSFGHMVRPIYPGMVLALGGDMVNGDIHEELAQTNEVTTIQQVVQLLDILVWAIDALVVRFGKVFVPCVVGNHGRTSHKPRMKGRAFTNYDWLLYTLLERHFKNNPRVTIVVPEGADVMFRVYGHRFFLTHGDALGVKGGDGIIGALGPIMRGKVKLTNSQAQIGRDFDTMLIGHYHQYITLPGLVVNGSVKGYDEFAQIALRAPYQHPTQALFFVHRKHGITCHWPVLLEDRPASNDEWVSWR